MQRLLRTTTTTLPNSLPTPKPGINGIQARVNRIIDEFMSSLPAAEGLTADQRRGIIARYTAVLEGNFIYWMTGAYLATKSEQAHSIIVDNLQEEVRDCHPGMMRRFAVAANAFPTDADALGISRELMNVRLFIGRLRPVRIVLMMAFFEGLIQRFMAYLADLAARQGSSEMEYTDVHGVCDVAHTAGLFRALEAEMALEAPESEAAMFEGVELLRTLLHQIVFFDASHTASVAQ